MKRIATLGFAVAVVLSGAAGTTGVVEDARDVPVAADVDVVVVGGTAAGVSAAVAAREAGATVFLAGGYPYLGEDMAGTLELACASDAGATPLERRLWTDSVPCARYAYDIERPFRYLGGWQYHNDDRDKFATANFPTNPGDSVLATNELSVCCTLHRPSDVASVDVLVIENGDRTRPAYRSVDHRGAIDRRAGPGPLTGSVRLEILDGPLGGRTLELTRDARTYPLGGDAVRAGEPDAVKSGATLVGASSRQVGVCYRVRVGASLGRVRLRVAPAAGAACHLLSRIRFRLGAAEVSDENPSPLKVKRTFDAVLAEKGVRSITWSPVSDLLADDAGVLSGVVIANRSGRQAIRAKCVVDATRYGTLSHLGQPLPGLPKTARFSRVVVSGARPAGRGFTVEPLPGGRFIDHVRATSRYRDYADCAVTGRIWRCLFDQQMTDGSYAAFAAAEWRARDLTWDGTTFDSADQVRLLSPLPPPAGRPALLTVRDDRPLGARIRAGARAGHEAAAFAKSRPAPRGVRVEAVATVRPATGTVREALGGLRPYDRTCVRLGSVPSPARELPVLGTWDVVVVGGGTAGTPSAVSAARAGARTLLVEGIHMLGGVGSDGMILGYYCGNYCGYADEYTKRVREQRTHTVAALYANAETLRHLCDEAGVQVWLGAFGEGAWVVDGTLRGVVVVTPQGRGVVLARTFVDGTGNSDLAAAAGAATSFIGGRELALQSAGQAPHRLGRGGINTDFGYVNDPDAWDLWVFGVRSRAGAPDPWDLQQLVDSRERRRIVPDLRVEGWDVIARRRFPDTVNRACSKQDSHGFLQDDYGTVAEADGLERHFVNLPLRAYLPKGIANLAVVGLGKGVARDVVPFTRMRIDLMNEGYAIGLCAAEAVRTAGGDYRRIDVRRVQKVLVEKGNLPPEVLAWEGDADLTDAELGNVLAGIGEGYRGSGYVFRYPARSLPILRREYARAGTPAAKQAFAILLGLFGDATGAETLVGLMSGTLKFQSLRNGYGYCGSGYDLNGLALALGRSHAPGAWEAFRVRFGNLDVAAASIGQIRPLALGLEALGDPAAAPFLAAALKTPGVGGWARTDVKELSPLGGYAVGSEMELCLRELSLARALYACGDAGGLARRTLEAYARDPRGALAEHANAVLHAAAHQ